MYPNMDELAAPVLTPEDRQALTQAVLKQCDTQDGVEDGIMNDPRNCDFDPASLDLSSEKLAAIQAVYDGPRNDQGPIFHGWPFGGENEDGGWGRWLAGSGQQSPDTPPSAAYGFGVDLMRYMVEHDPQWRYENFSFNDYWSRVELLDSVLSAKNPDIDAFRDAGGKLLLYHGWSRCGAFSLSDDRLCRIRLRTRPNRSR